MGRPVVFAGGEAALLAVPMRLSRHSGPAEMGQLGYPGLGTFLLVLVFLSPRAAVALEPNEIFRIAARSVVSVATVGATPMQGSGVTLAPGVVVTNCHVVASAKAITVWGASAIRYRARVVGRQERQDLCMLAVEGLDTVPAVAEYNSLPSPGERVYAVGSPRGLELTISEGLVSGVRSTAIGSFVQTTAPISPGSSGGGLFDQNGHLVALTSLALSSSQNLNFAIPVTRVKTWFGTDFSVLAQPLSNDVAMRDAVAAAIAFPKGDVDPPRPVFSTLDDRLAYLQWLGAMSDRLRQRSTELITRIEFLQTVWYESRRSGLEPALVLGLIDSTSGFRKFAISETGSRGYMQISPGWATRIGDGDSAKLFHMQSNLRIGCVLLRHFLELEQGDMYQALIRYDAEVVRPRRASDAAAFPNKVFNARRRWEL